jgi:hypothetical protein
MQMLLRKTITAYVHKLPRFHCKRAGDFQRPEQRRNCLLCAQILTGGVYRILQGAARRDINFMFLQPTTGGSDPA